MKVFFATFLTGLAIVGLFNFYVDPAQRWHTSRVETMLNFKQNWKRDEVFLTPENYDERLFVMAHLKVVPKPDVVILGSSRCMIIDSWMFNDNVSIFNAGMSGGSIQDYIAIWQSFKNQNKLPSSLVIFLDPWVFNKHSGQSRWLTNADLYAQFFDKSLLPIRYSLKRWKRVALDVVDLLTLAILERSLLDLRKKVDPIGIVKINEMPPEAYGKKYDGSRVFPVEMVQKPSLDKITALSIKHVSGDVYSLSNWSFDESYYQEMRRLLQDIHGHGTKTLIVLPPYQHYVFKKLQELPQYKFIFPSVVNTIVGRLAKEPGTSFDFCDALDPIKDGCSETEFMDGHHMLRSCAEKVVRKCLAGFDSGLSYSLFPE